MESTVRGHVVRACYRVLQLNISIVRQTSNGIPDIVEWRLESLTRDVILRKLSEGNRTQHIDVTKQSHWYLGLKHTKFETSQQDRKKGEHFPHTSINRTLISDLPSGVLWHMVTNGVVKCKFWKYVKPIFMTFEVWKPWNFRNRRPRLDMKKLGNFKIFETKRQLNIVPYIFSVIRRSK